MYNRVLRSVDDVKHTIRNAYSEQDWLLIVLKNNGWSDNKTSLTPYVESTVGLISIGELNIIARRESIPTLMPALDKVKITVDFRIPGYDGVYHTVESLKYPTDEDIRAVLLRLNSYTGYNIIAPIATRL